MKELKEYFSGKKLYGDDFNLQQIKEWYEDEKEGYSGLVDEKYKYEFHEFNKYHGFSKIKQNKLKHALSFGGAFGDELLPIINKMDFITIVEPSKKLRAKNLADKPIKYVDPQINGRLKFSDKSFDIITCLGVLHHIPNVSFVFSELCRVLKPGGFLILREPIVSMGDWRNFRKGLTKRERGIPPEHFKKLIKKNNLEIIYERKVMFPLIRRIEGLGIRPYNSKVLVFIDDVLSRLFAWNDRYHSTNLFHKVRPQSIFYVLKRTL